MSASYDRLATRLPFHLDDVSRVNDAFVAWRRTGDPDAAHVVDLWTYLYTCRYFRAKFARETGWGASELDELTNRAVDRLWVKRASVRQPEHYASWVSVVCKRTFLNWLRRRRRLLSLDATEGPRFVDALVAEPAPPPETVRVRAAVADAVNRLPPFLQPVARLRFVEGASYAAIARRLGKPPPIVRSYAFKARGRLRRDPLLRDLFGLDGGASGPPSAA